MGGNAAAEKNKAVTGYADSSKLSNYSKMIGKESELGSQSQRKKFNKMTIQEQNKALGFVDTAQMGGKDPTPAQVTMGNPASMTQAQARAELQKIGPTISGSGGNYNDLSSFDNYNFSGSPFTLEYFKAVAARAGSGDELNVIHGGSGGKPANTSPSNTNTTTTGNAASTAESTSADTLQSSQQGVTISDEAKAKAAALNLELVNTDAIQGTNEADTLQKKQAALLEAERRQAIRRLIARNRRARFGGSRLLMSSARSNPGLGVPQSQTTLSPRMNPRDSYA
jgi:hypothetical protein